NLKSGEVEDRVPVGVAPYMPLVVGRKVYVSNWGGAHPGKDDPQHKTSGTPVKTDPRTSVVTEGSVSGVMSTGKGWFVMSITVSGDPCGMVVNTKGKFLYVACANSDTIDLIDLTSDTRVGMIDCRPEGKLPFGSGSNALALRPEGGTLYVANGTNNCIA